MRQESKAFLSEQIARMLHAARNQAHMRRVADMNTHKRIQLGCWLPCCSSLQPAAGRRSWPRQMSPPKLSENSVAILRAYKHSIHKQIGEGEGRYLSSKSENEDGDPKEAAAAGDGRLRGTEVGRLKPVVTS
jgi:hypothetical protein